MRFLLVESALFEGIASVRARFPKIDDETFDTIIRLDPTFKEGKDVVGTYGKWLLTLFQNGKLQENQFSEVTDLLNQFDANKRYLSNKDIGQYKTLDDVRHALSNVVINKSTNRAEKDAKKSVKKNGFEHKDVQYVGHFDGYDLYIPKSYEGDVVLATLPDGTKAKWCTAGGDGRNNGREMYDRYLAQGGFYLVIINPNNLNERYQFHAESWQFMNERNKPINIGRFLYEHKALFDEYVELLTAHGGNKQAGDLFIMVSNFSRFNNESDYAEYMVNNYNKDNPSDPITEYELVDNYNDDALATFYVNDKSLDMVVFPSESSVQALNGEEFDFEVNSILDDPETLMSYLDIYSMNELLNQDNATSVGRIIDYYKDAIVRHLNQNPNLIDDFNALGGFVGDVRPFLYKLFEQLGITDVKVLDDVDEEGISKALTEVQNKNPQLYADTFFDVLKGFLLDEFDDNLGNVVDVIDIFTRISNNRGSSYFTTNLLADIITDTDIFNKNKIREVVVDGFGQWWEDKWIVDFTDSATKMVLVHCAES